MEGDNKSTNFEETNSGTPNYFVAASKREDIFTLGDKYDASILNSDPIAPSIPQPICNPKPILIL